MNCRTLNISSPFWCDLGFISNSGGNKAAANLCPKRKRNDGSTAVYFSNTKHFVDSKKNDGPTAVNCYFISPSPNISLKQKRMMAKPLSTANLISQNEAFGFCPQRDRYVECGKMQMSGPSAISFRSLAARALQSQACSALLSLIWLAIC